MTERHVEADKVALADAIADRLAAVTADAVAARGVAHLVLTGGSMGTAVLEALDRRGHSDLPWESVHLWWGDERFLPEGDDDRNVVQARKTLLDRLPVPEGQVHPMAASDGPDGDDLAAAAQRYARELAAADGDGSGCPTFDVVMLGMGPDTHVASLFPGHPQTRVTDTMTTFVSDSPKPPPGRISMTFTALNTSREVWLMIAGADKADAVRAAAGSHDATEHPASGVRGQERTIWWLDRAAAGSAVD